MHLLASLPHLHTLFLAARHFAVEDRQTCLRLLPSFPTLTHLSWEQCNAAWRDPCEAQLSAIADCMHLQHLSLHLAPLPQSVLLSQLLAREHALPRLTSLELSTLMPGHLSDGTLSNTA